jgi:hypothetical protein
MSGCRRRHSSTIAVPVFVLAAVLIGLSEICLQTVAAAQTTSSSSAGSSTSHGLKAQADETSRGAGSVSNGLYRNPVFGFVCKVPPGWVLRTREMNQEELQDEKDDAGKNATKGGRVLLAAFSRPPEARAEDVNASILIAAESASVYPGLNDAAQYFGPVTEVAKAQGFAVDEEPYEFAVGAKKLVRGDYEKNVGTRVMRQSTLVMLVRGYALSFTFIGGTEDEVGELLEGLSFAAGAKTSH